MYRAVPVLHPQHSSSTRNILHYQVFVGNSAYVFLTCRNFMMMDYLHSGNLHCMDFRNSHCDLIVDRAIGAAVSPKPVDWLHNFESQTRESFVQNRRKYLRLGPQAPTVGAQSKRGSQCSRAFNAMFISFTTKLNFAHNGSTSLKHTHTHTTWGLSLCAYCNLCFKSKLKFEIA
jgi:hypothetical protein